MRRCAAVRWGSGTRPRQQSERRSSQAVRWLPERLAGCLQWPPLSLGNSRSSGRLPSACSRSRGASDAGNAEVLVWPVLVPPSAHSQPPSSLGRYDTDVLTCRRPRSRSRSRTRRLAISPQRKPTNTIVKNAARCWPLRCRATASTSPMLRHRRASLRLGALGSLTETHGLLGMSWSRTPRSRMARRVPVAAITILGPTFSLRSATHC